MSATPFDPEEPDSFEASRAGGEAGADEAAETPEADAAEQRAEVEQHQDEPMRERPADDEVNPSDAAEQARIVELNEDEYR